jgi:hypothetical protein
MVFRDGCDQMGVVFGSASTLPVQLLSVTSRRMHGIAECAQDVRIPTALSGSTATSRAASHLYL